MNEPSEAASARAPAASHAPGSLDGPDELALALPPPARASRLRVALVLAAVTGGTFAIGYTRHRPAHGDAPAQRGGRAVRVEVIKPTLLAGERALELPGTVRPLEETRISPRVSGYVRRWLVDLGDKVTAGQLLAEIDTPELDAQLAQARAQLAQARAAVGQATAQRDLSKANATRVASLSGQQLVSQTQLEQASTQAQTDEAHLAATHAAVAAAEANVRRLAGLTAFARVTAPFAGTITTRSIDRGTLVTEGNATPMFTVVATDPVRVFLDVPQSLAPSVKPGVAATITVRELGDRKLEGTIARAAGALDPELHTMTTELRVPNPDGALLPGMYVRAQLKLPVPAHIFEIPATALYFDAQGVRVAVVDPDSRIRIVPIVIERDTGATLHVASGLQGDERLLKIAIPWLPAGSLVEVAAPATAAAPSTATTGPGSPAVPATAAPTAGPAAASR